MQQARLALIFKTLHVLFSIKFRLHGLELIQVQAFPIKKKTKNLLV